MFEENSPADRPEISGDSALNAEYMRAAAGAPYGGATMGEVLYVAREVAAGSGSRDSYIAAWTDLGRRVADSADDALRSGRRATALSAYLRAYNYLRAAEYFFPAQLLEERRERYADSVAQFDAALPLMPFPAEKIEVPYRDGVFIPGYFFRAAGVEKPRATVVVCGGQDGAGEEMYFLAGVPEASARGLNVLTFHGPGQRGLQLYHPDLGFRPESEEPIAAVIDYASTRPEVDGDRIGLYGMSFGGYLAPRAAAYDRRINALACNAPILDLLQIIMGTTAENTPDGAEGELRAAPWSTRAYVENYLMWHHGVSGPVEFADHAARFTLDGMVGDIACPVLSLAAAGETKVAMDQARRFHDMVKSTKRFAELTARQGADGHCGVGNVPHTSGLVYDWFAETLGTRVLSR
ncbi:prolyl oligopeptidase family serine peptidase [Nocardia sp. NPDC019395]|uniref:alpha/beta hydrolase family protein n=1 Tax=Nocardia sp. NPDC019395 TaxID=3154686 RepID=UPI0033D1863A